MGISSTDFEGYRVKTIKYSEDGPGAYPIMIVKVMGEPSKVLREMGYRAGASMYVLMEGPREGFYYDETRLAQSLGVPKPTRLAKFLMELVDNFDLWHSIKDGEKIHQNELEEYIDG